MVNVSTPKLSGYMNFFLWIWSRKFYNLVADTVFNMASGKHSLYFHVGPITGLVFGLKGHWTTSASSSNFFQKSWDFYTIRSVYLCSNYLLNLICNFNLITKKREFFFCSGHFLKSTFKNGRRCHDCWILHHPPLF